MTEGVPYPRRTATILANKQNQGNPNIPGSAAGQKYKGDGGFPGPVQLTRKALHLAVPTAMRKLERKLTLPHVQTLEEQKVPWLNFNGLVVGRNSDFQTETLTDEQLEDIGGAEYRALRYLSYLVPMVCI